MNIKDIPLVELIDLVELYESRVENARINKKDSEDEFVAQTLDLKINEYHRNLRTLNGELKRRKKERLITDQILIEKQSETDNYAFIHDSKIIFHNSHFKRFESGIVDQDMPTKIDIGITFENNADRVTIELPISIQSGTLIVRSKNRLFYRGDLPEGDFELFIENGLIKQLIIYQSKTGAEFLYT